MATLRRTRVPLLPASPRAVRCFRRAHAYWRFRAFDRSIPLLEELIQDFPHHPVAELGGALLLDALASSDRGDELVMWLDLLVHMDGFLDDKPSLRANVREYRRRYLRSHRRALNENRRAGLAGSS